MQSITDELCRKFLDFKLNDFSGSKSSSVIMWILSSQNHLPNTTKSQKKKKIPVHAYFSIKKELKLSR